MNKTIFLLAIAYYSTQNKLAAHERSVSHPETETYYRTPIKKRSKSKRISPGLRALQKDNLERLNRLLDENVCLNTEDPFGMTPLDYAISIESVYMVRLLLNRGACVNSSTLHFAIYQGDESKNRDIILLLLKHGACPKALNFEDKTPLQVAEECKHIKTIQLLKSCEECHS